MIADIQRGRSDVIQLSGCISAVLLGAALLLPASASGQADPPRGNAKLEQGKKGRDVSFPAFRQAGDLPAKKLEPSVPKNAVAAKLAPAKTGREELLLMQTREALPLRKSRSLGVTPFIDKAFAKGTLVWLLEVDAEAKSSKVAVLGGLEGYIFAKYVEASEDNGWGRINTNNVNFRHQARAAIFPVDVTKEGMRVKLLAKEGDWWRVLSNQQLGVWVPSSGLELQARIKPTGAKPHERIASEALRSRATKQIEERERPWVEGLSSRMKAAKRQQDLADLERALGDFRVEFERLMTETGGDPDLDALTKIAPLLSKIESRAGELQTKMDSVGGKIALMLNEFKRSTLLAESKLIVVKRPGQVKVVDGDYVRRSQAMRPSFTGWIVYRPGRRHISDYQLVKGNKTIFYLTCSSNRYELGDFVDRRISIRAQTHHIASASFRVADIKKLLILSSGH